MLSRRSAVCSSPLESHDAMSPAPTTTGSPGGGGGGAVTVIVLVPCAVIIAPVKSRAVASSSTALPTLIVAVDGWITTVAALAGGGIGVSLTVTAATAATLRNTATIDVLPAATAETRPCAFTFA